MTNWNRKQINNLSDLNKNRQENKNRKYGIIEEEKKDLFPKSDLLDDFYNVDGCGLIDKEVFEEIYSNMHLCENVRCLPYFYNAMLYQTILEHKENHKIKKEIIK